MRCRLLSLARATAVALVLCLCQPAFAAPGAPNIQAAAACVQLGQPALDALPAELRTVLVQLVPAYHALLKEGQLPDAAPSTALPAAVHAAFAALASEQARGGNNPLICAWRGRAHQALGDLAAASTLASTLQPSRRLVQALTELAQLAQAAQALQAAPGPSDAGSNMLAEQHATPQRAAALYQPMGPGADPLFFEPLAQLQHAVAQLAAPPPQIAPDLVARMHLDPNNVRAELHWTAPRPGHHAPAAVRLWQGQLPGQDKEHLLQLARCQGLDVVEAAQAANNTLALLPTAWTMLAELPRSAEQLVVPLGSVSAVVPPSFAIAAVSPFGVQGPHRTVTAGALWPTLMPALDVSAGPVAPALNDDNFYRDVDAVRVAWAPSLSPNQADKDLGQATKVPQLARYDIYRMPASAAAQALVNSAIGVKQTAPLGAVPCSIQPPDARYFVGSVTSAEKQFFDRPGAQLLAQGLHYQVVSVGLDEHVSVAPSICSSAAVPPYAAADQVVLARAGAETLIYPTKFEQTRAQVLAAPGALAAARQQFVARGPQYQARLWQSFWRVTPPQLKARWRSRWGELLGDAGRQQALKAAPGHLPESIARYVQTVLFAQAHPASEAAIAHYGSLMTAQQRQAALQQWQELSRIMGPQPLPEENPSGHAETSGAGPVWLLGWRHSWDVKDEQAWATWWTLLGEAKQAALLQTWFDHQTQAAQAHMAWPPLTVMSEAAERDYMEVALAQIPEGLWPAFLAYATFDDLPLAEKASMIAQETTMGSRVKARVRYALRPLDAYLAFDRALACLIMVMGLTSGFLLHLATTAQQKRRRR